MKYACGKWMSSMKKDGEKLWSALLEPEVRRTLYYDCGVFCRRCGKKPLMQIHADHEYSVPLLKVVGIGALVLASMGTLSFCLRWMQK